MEMFKVKDEGYHAATCLMIEGKITARDKGLFDYLVYRWRSKRNCYPATRTIEQETGVPRSALPDCIKRLVKCGLVKDVDKIIIGGRRRNRYHAQNHEFYRTLGSEHEKPEKRRERKREKTYNAESYREKMAKLRVETPSEALAEESLPDWREDHSGSCDIRAGKYVEPEPVGEIEIETDIPF